MKTNIATYYTVVGTDGQEKLNEKAYLKAVETANGDAISSEFAVGSPPTWLRTSTQRRARTC